MKRIAIMAVVVLACVSAAAAVGAAAQGKLPKMITLGSLSRTYEPVRFDHEKHLSLANGCEDCHHQHRGMEVAGCAECHRFNPATFRANLRVEKVLPCKDCHMAVERPGAKGQLDLKTAYHNACNKCHWGEVNSKNLAGCTESCHVAKVAGKQEKAKPAKK